MTEKLYYKDSHMREFEAVVTGCEKDRKGYRVILDRTAFFPEGGGQCADSGELEILTGLGSETDVSAEEKRMVQVLDVQEADGSIYHVTDAPISQGTAVKGILDWTARFSNMQQHSGEHILSGLVHRTFGYDNVGFHLGREIVTMDFNGSFTEEELKDIETRANEAVFSNLKIQTGFPDREALCSMEYRSKIELEGEVRIVTIPGIDVCACCAPHVDRTGEIGLIKIVDAQNYKGGTRITIQCGIRALTDYRKKQDNIRAISVALSARQDETALAVEKVKAETADLKVCLARAQGELIRYKAEAVACTEGSICLFEEGLDAKAMRELVNLLVPKTKILAAVFSGSTKDGFRYILGSQTMDMRNASKALNQAFSGRGGGSAAMAQGTVFGEKEKIKEYIDEI